MSFSNNDHPKDGAGEPSMEEILASIRRILKDEAVKSPTLEADDDILVLDSSMVAKPVDLSTATSPPAAPLPVTESPATPLQSTAAPLHFASEPTLISPIYTPPPAAPEPDLVITPRPVQATGFAAAPEPMPEFEPVPYKPAGLSPPPIAPVFGGRPFTDFPVLQPESPAVPPFAEPAIIAPSAAAPPPPAPEPEPEPEPAPAPQPAPEPAPEPAPDRSAPQPSPRRPPNNRPRRQKCRIARII